MHIQATHLKVATANAVVEDFYLRMIHVRTYIVESWRLLNLNVFHSFHSCTRTIKLNQQQQ